MGVEMITAYVRAHIQPDEEELRFFLSLLQPRTIRRGEFLLKEGAVCRYDHFITKGCLRAYTVDAQGAEHIVQFGMERWWITDMYSFLSQAPARLMIDALEDTEVLQLSRQDMEQLYIRVPKFERFFRILFQQAFIAHEERIAQNLSLTAEARYLLFTGKYPQIEQRIPQKQIAAYLGITPVFLSMIRRKLSKKQ